MRSSGIPIFKRKLLGFAGLASVLASGALGATPTPITPPAVSIDPPPAGVYADATLPNIISEYPGVSTVIRYAWLDDDRLDATSSNLATHSGIEARLGLEIAPQYGAEIQNSNVSGFVADMENPESATYQRVARFAQAVKTHGKRVYIRAFSEMNNGSQNSPWVMGYTERGNYVNTPSLLAKAWILLREAFEREQAKNALFIFSPLVARGIDRSAEVGQILRRIPAGYIDLFGFNIYSRPRSHYGERGTPAAFYVPVRELVQPWIALHEASPHRDVPLIISEMAVSRQGSDEERARWIREAFAFAKEMEFKGIAYFNLIQGPDAGRRWDLDPGSLAHATLVEEINRFSPAPEAEAIVATPSFEPEAPADGGDRDSQDDAEE